MNATTAREPAIVNLFNPTPFSAGAGASDGVPDIEEGGKALVPGAGEDKDGGGEGGEVIVAGEGAFADGAFNGEGADTGDVGEDAGDGVATGDLDGEATGDDAGDCATEVPTSTTIRIKNANLEQAIAISFLPQ